MILKYNGKYVFPFGELMVGEAFEAPTEAKKSIYSAASHYGARHDKKFSIKKKDGVFVVCRIK